MSSFVKTQWCTRQGHQEISNNPYGILAGVKDGECFLANEWGAAICDEMTPQPGDLIVKGKTGLCGFHSTNLDFLLRQNNIQNVVLAGFLTNCCVESSMRTAYENGYRVYTLLDCCAATSIEGQQAAYDHTFGMFSVPTDSNEFLQSLQPPGTGTGGNVGSTYSSTMDGADTPGVSVENGAARW